MPDPKKIPLEIDCLTVKSMLDAKADFLLVDCREAEEYQTAHIAQAQLLPMSAIQERLGELEPHRNREIVVHCHHGGRSLRVTSWLRGQGFENVKSMAGGIDQWSTQIDPSVPRY